MGPLHGPRRLTVPVVECWTTLSMAAGADVAGRRSAPFVLNVMNRHPAVVARMASTLQIASGGRLMLGIGIGGAPKEHAAYGIDFPAAPERVARLEEAVAVIRALWTGGPVTRRLAVLSAGRGGRVSRCRTRAARSSSAARPGRGPAGRADRRRLDTRSTTTSSRTCRSTSRRSRPPVGGARTSASSSGSRATGWATSPSRDRLGRGAARDVGALARGRRGRGDRPGPDDRRRGRPGGARPGAGSDAFVAPSAPVTRPPTTPGIRQAAGARPAHRPSRPMAARGAAPRSRPVSGCASSATRSGCATSSASQVHGIADRRRHRVRRGPGHRRPGSPSPASGRSGDGR